MQEEKFYEYMKKQINEILRFKTILEAEKGIFLDENEAARLWINRFADDFRNTNCDFQLDYSVN